MDYFSRGVGGVATPPLVMHFCDAKTLLALARCNRVLLAAASCTFAWKHCPPFTISTNDVWINPYKQNTLLRFAPSIELDWRDLGGSVNEKLDCVREIPNLRTLDLMLTMADNTRLDVILRAPCMQSLHVLHTSFDPWTYKNAIAFPRSIHTLVLGHAFLLLGTHVSKDIRLPELPHLTSLRLDYRLRPELAMHIGLAYPRLQSLHVYMDAVSCFDALVANARLVHLRYLEIDTNATTMHGIADGFLRNAPRLETIVLRNTGDSYNQTVGAIESILIGIADQWQSDGASSALRSIVFQPCWTAQFPSHAFMKDVLDATKPLRITFEMPECVFSSINTWCGKFGLRLYGHDDAHVLREKLATLRSRCLVIAEAFPGRVSLSG